MARNLYPGYCVVQQPGSLSLQTRLIFPNSNSSAARYFKQINSDTPWLKPGQILVIADPDNPINGNMLNAFSQVKKGE